MVSSLEFVTCARNAIKELIPVALSGAGRADTNVVTKRDGSLVTAIDHEVEARLLAAFHASFPGVPVLGEEGALDRQAQSASLMYREFIESDYQIIIDPIDGTKNFINGHPQYCIAVALSKSQRGGMWPVAGVIAIPEEQTVYWGDERGVFAEDLMSGQQRQIVRANFSSEQVSVNSRDRAWLAEHNLKLINPWVSSGSSVYDFLGTVLGRNKASIAGSQRLWDLMAPLALALCNGLTLRDLETGSEVTSITMDHLSADIRMRPWGLSRKMLLAPSTVEFSQLLTRT